MYSASIVVERRNERMDETLEDGISRVNMKEMLDQSLRKMIGMSMDDLKIKLGEIEQVKADIKAMKQAETTQMRYINFYPTDII
jgi:hypothetical protein